MLICFTWACNIFYSVWWSPATILFVYLLTNVLSISLSLLSVQQFFNTTLFYSCHFPLAACPIVCRMQNVPFFSSASSFSSSPAPLSSLPSVPPLHPAPRQLKAHFTPVGEGSTLVRPTSLPSAPETGTGAGGFISLFSAFNSYSSCSAFTCVSPPILPCFSLVYLFFPASWLSEWRPPKTQAPLAQSALSPKFLHLSANDPGQPAVLRKKQRIELPCNVASRLTSLMPAILCVFTWTQCLFSCLTYYYCFWTIITTIITYYY